MVSHSGQPTSLARTRANPRVTAADPAVRAILEEALYQAIDEAVKVQ